MSNQNNTINDIEFLHSLRTNRLKTPNEFTIAMGQLIKKAREDEGPSQVEFAKKVNRRPATISDIENGKSEIGVLTLTLFSIELSKPISYFFPQSILKDLVVDVRTPFQHEMLKIAKEVEAIGDPLLTLDILKVLVAHYEMEEEYIRTGYDPNMEE